jgi:hypothetical protein
MFIVIYLYTYMEIRYYHLKEIGILLRRIEDRNY